MMRKFLLATTMLVAPLAAQAQNLISPGQGSLTDADGNVWTISTSGSIQENGQWTPGGGGTALLSIVNGVVYGEDAYGRGWFTLSGGDTWVQATAPNAGADPSSTSSQPTTVSATPSPCPTSASSGDGTFHVSGGQIIGPDGKPFIARGIAVMEFNKPTLAQVQAAFPGTNYVRLAMYDYASADTLRAYITPFTNAGIVVNIENHQNFASNGGGNLGYIFSGQRLVDEQTWYSSVAAMCAGNTYCWFSTNNEPSHTNVSGADDPAGLAAWQRTTIQTIRATGNNNIVLVEANCDPQNMCDPGYPADAFAGLHNIGRDPHFYNWLTGYSSDQTVISAWISRQAQSAQRLTSADGTVPVLFGEVGNSTSGTSIDPGGVEAVAAMINFGATGQYGSAYWAWALGVPAGSDGLVDGNNRPSNPFGQQVALYTNTSVVAPSACALNNSAIQAIADATNTITTSASQKSAATNAATAVDPASAEADETIQTTDALVAAMLTSQQ